MWRPGQSTSVSWTGLTVGAQYEWYATASDGTTMTTGPTAGFTAAAANTAPVAVADSYTASEDATLNVSVPGVLGNDTDVDGDTLHAAVVSGPSHGSLALGADGSFSYSPIPNFNGTDRSHRHERRSLDSTVATVSISVAAVNDAPVAVNGTRRSRTRRQRHPGRHRR
jgi:VCBS repeat-containing protein